MSNQRTAIYCKSFRDDFGRLRLLLESLSTVGCKDFPFLLSVPESDRKLLSDTLTIPNNVVVISDESYLGAGKVFQYGWLQQQICKLSVFRTDFADAYLMLDSDTYLIGPLTSQIFFTGEHKNIVYSDVFTKFFSENDRLRSFINGKGSNPKFLENEGAIEQFSNRLRIIYDEMQSFPNRQPDEKGQYIQRLFSGRAAAVQPAQIFHSSFLHAFEKFLNLNGLDFYKCIEIAPWEYNWYAYFVATGAVGPVIGITSPVIHFATEKDVADAKSLGFTKEVLKKEFRAIQMAARHFETVEF